MAWEATGDFLFRDNIDGFTIFDMILAFHSIFSTYGFWLPNEPRGSWSTFVASWELFRYGPATTVTTRRSIAHRPYDRILKHQMRASLQHPPVRLAGEQARVVGKAFATCPYELHGLAILPDHVHVVLAHTERHIRHVVRHLKSAATRALRERGWFPDRTPWAEHGWNVFLEGDDDVARAIGYVERNPEREGLRRQRWSCVRPCDPCWSRRTRG